MIGIVVSSAEFMRLKFAQALASAGISEQKAFASGAEALKAIGQNTLVLIDIADPHTAEVVTAGKGKGLTLVCAPSEEITEVRALMQQGADEFILKPFSDEDLANKARALVAAKKA